MRARVPASAANLGPGFDTLALALTRHLEVTVEPAPRLRITASGCGADVPSSPDHLAAQVVRRVLGHDDVEIHVWSEIPLARGLGSSAALAAAAAAAAGASDPLWFASEVDGHAENAGASVLGGLVVATMIDGKPFARRLPLDPELVFVVVIPDRLLKTKEARAALPKTIPHADAAFNLGRMGLLIAGLADHRKLSSLATADRLHQEQRTPLFPESRTILAGLVDAGALAACWSGAGPSLLGMVHWSKAEAVRKAGERLLEETGLLGECVVLEADTQGLVVSPG